MKYLFLSKVTGQFMALLILVLVIDTQRGYGQKAVEKVIERQIVSEKGTFKLTQLVEGLKHPWAVNFLNDNEIIITERPGNLLLISGKEIIKLTNLPTAFDDKEDLKSAPQGGNQGGLLDAVPHPDYAKNGWIYFTYTSKGDDDSNFGDGDYATGTTIARAKINKKDKALYEVEVLYTQAPKTEPGRHYGSRIVFLGDGTLLFSIGDRGIRYPSQDLTDPAGSMIRIKEEGGVPSDNPFINKEPGNLRPEIFSFGHRNNQGIAVQPATGEIWATEHGPYGGDLVHLIKKGANYGWPQVTQGVEYDSKAPIGLGKEAPGVEKPKYIWEESMAPSGLAFYHKGNIPGWNGSLFAGSLLKEQIHRLEIANGAVTGEEILLTKKIGRIRDIRMGPDGDIYIVTDEKNGGLYKLSKAE